MGRKAKDLSGQKFELLGMLTAQYATEKRDKRISALARAEKPF